MTKVYIGEREDLEFFVGDDVINFVFNVFNANGTDFDFSGFSDVNMEFYDGDTRTRLLKSLVNVTNINISGNQIILNADYSSEIGFKISSLYYKMTYVDASSRPITVFYGNANFIRMTTSSEKNVLSNTSLPAISAAAQAVLDRMTGLTQTQEDAIIAFVNTMDSVGNWDLVDDFWLFPLGNTTPANGLEGFKAKTAVDVNSVGWNAGGVVPNGSNSYLNMNYNPNTDGLLDNAMIGTYMKSSVSSSWYSGCKDGSVNYFQCVNQGTSTRANVNQAAENANSKTYAEPQNLVGVRTASNVIDQYIDGISDHPLNTVSSARPNLNCFVGAINNNGSPTFFRNSNVSAFIVGKAVGFDHLTYYNALITMLTSLGAV